MQKCSVTTSYSAHALSRSHARNQRGIRASVALGLALPAIALLDLAEQVQAADLLTLER